LLDGAVNVVIFIPARLGSTRYPGKPLVGIRGASGAEKPLIQRSVEAAARAAGANKVVVLTDDESIELACRGFGAEALMTSGDCRNGTERCAEALGTTPEADLVINFQGDALLTPPAYVEALIDTMRGDADLMVATPAIPLRPEEIRDLQEEEAAGRVGGTSVVVDDSGNALYFSKRLLPYLPKGRTDATVRQHIGVYAYRPEALRRYAATPMSEIEDLEGLEQLRFLAAGISIKVVDVPSPPFTLRELNNPEDLPAIEAALAEAGLE
jgi:3-deoxy-manno-octulosonate cytidylyltransferase (CMP-KDO synthetase)